MVNRSTRTDSNARPRRWTGTSQSRLPAFHFETGCGLGYGPGDLCGSGMDVFVAGVYVTETGTMTGIDVTDEQVEKARTLPADERRVFEEANRVLELDGRVALADSIENDADLWAACVGGAARIDSYTSLVETAGVELQEVRKDTQYEFIPGRAANACRRDGVKSISLCARRRSEEGTYNDQRK